MSSFLIKSFKGGISDYEDKGLAGAFKFGSGLSIRRKRDTLYAQQALKDDLAVSGVMDARCRFIVPSSDDNSYWFLENGKILKRTSAGVWSLVFTDADGDIIGAEEWSNDNSETGMYWATATKLHRKPIPGNADWTIDDDVDAGSPVQTYPKTNLTSADWHTMKIVNGSLLICNDETIALVGYDESYTNNALQLTPGSVAKAIIESGVNAKIGANRSDDKQESTIYLWDTISQNFNDKLQLPFADINALVDGEISIAQFGTDGKLYFFGDKSKLPVTAFTEGGQVDPGGVEVDDGLALFGVYDNGDGYSGIYSYGRNKKNGDFVLNLEYQFDCDEITAVKKIGTDILFSYKEGTTYGVKIVDTANKVATAKYQSLDLKAPPTFQTEPVWDNVVVVMAPLPANTSVEVWRRMNKLETGGDGSGWAQCNLADGTTDYDTAGGTEGVFLLGDKGKYCELQIILNCNGNSSPEVLQVQPYFS